MTVLRGYQIDAVAQLRQSIQAGQRRVLLALETGAGKTAVTLNNFCKLQEMGPDDEDDILSCVSFLLADVVHARDLIGKDLRSDRAK